MGGPGHQRRPGPGIARLGALHPWVHSVLVTPVHECVIGMNILILSLLLPLEPRYRAVRKPGLRGEATRAVFCSNSRGPLAKHLPLSIRRGSGQVFRCV